MNMVLLPKIPTNTVSFPTTIGIHSDTGYWISDTHNGIYYVDTRDTYSMYVPTRAGRNQVFLVVQIMEIQIHVRVFLPSTLVKGVQKAPPLRRKFLVLGQACLTYSMPSQKHPLESEEQCALATHDVASTYTLSTKIHSAGRMQAACIHWIRVTFGIIVVSCSIIVWYHGSNPTLLINFGEGTHRNSHTMRPSQRSSSSSQVLM